MKSAWEVFEALDKNRVGDPRAYLASFQMACCSVAMRLIRCLVSYRRIQMPTGLCNRQWAPCIAFGCAQFSL